MSADVQSRKILKNLKENNLVPQSLKAKPLVQHMYRERIESKTVQRPGNVFALKFTLCFRTKKCIFALNYSLVRIEMINSAIKQTNIVWLREKIVLKKVRISNKIVRINMLFVFAPNFKLLFSVTRKEADELLAETAVKPANDGQPYTILHFSASDDEGQPRLNALFSSTSIIQISIL